MAEKKNAEVIGIGDLIRQTIEKGGNDPFVAEIKKRYDAGVPQPDEVAIDLVQNYLQDLQGSAIFDNFPFTVGQAEFLDKFVSESTDWSSLIIYIKIDPEIAVRRATSRKVCTSCGAIYAAIDEMVCEKCGGSLMVRTDDSQEVMRTRISHYLPKIKEVIDYYKQKDAKVIEIDGGKTVSQVTKEIDSKI